MNGMKAIMEKSTCCGRDQVFQNLCSENGDTPCESANNPNKCKTEEAKECNATCHDECSETGLAKGSLCHTDCLLDIFNFFEYF